MEVAVKPTKPSSNISEAVSKFVGIRRVRSIGVISSESTNHFEYQYMYKDRKESVNEIEKSVNEIEKSDAKVVPDLIDVCSKTNWSCHGDVLKVFDVMTELKLAYVQLQEAHIHYDPEKIRAADELVFSNIDRLCKVRRAIKEKQFQISNSLSACLTVLRGETKVQERLLERLKAQAKKKDVEICYLKGEFEGLNGKNKLLVEDVKRRKREEIKRVDNVVKELSKGIHDFAKPLIALMKASGWDLDEAANSIQDSVVYSVRSHKKYAFEAYISRRMFYGFSFKFHNVDDVLRFDDPVDVLIEDPSSSFSEFCRTKYLLIVHPRIEASFFGNLDQRNFVSSGRHPMTPFYQSFVKMARWVWVLEGIAASKPESEMFVVNRGSKFCGDYMESVEGSLDEEDGRYKVELMVVPGFIIGNELFKSRVYLSKL